MALSDLERLAKMDEKILDLEYLYTREVMREQELNKHTLLLSRGFKYRIEALRKARNNFKKNMSMRAPTKKMNYAITLAEKKNKLIDAEEELSFMRKQYADLMTQVLVTRNDVDAQKAIDLAAEIKSQQSRVNAYANSVARFIERGAEVSRGNTPTREYIKHNAEKDASEVLYNESNQPRTVESILERNPNWSLRTSVNTAIPNDILNPPEQKKRVVIDFDE